MGQIASFTLKPLPLLLLSLSSVACADTTAGKPVTIFVGLSASGKSSIVGSNCDANLRTSSNMDSTTNVEEMNRLLECGGRPTYDTVGLGDIPKGESIENAMHRGLEKVLSFLDGKNIGHIYFVTSSSYMREGSRLLEQVQVIQGMLDPRTKWTVVINCFNGLCPSEDNTANTEFLQELTKIIPNFVEVRNPHKEPVNRALFPAPVTGYTTNLPPNWREIIEGYNIDTLRIRTTDEAIANCKDHQDAYVAASEAIKNDVCSVESCVPTECKPDVCPSMECPHPLCHTADTCKRREVSKNSGLLGVVDKILGSTRVETTSMDSDCLDAITTCNVARSASCREHTAHVMQCNAANSEDCLNHQSSHQNCVLQRSVLCEAEKAAVNDIMSAVMAEHDPYVQDCQKFYTTHSTK